MSTGHDGCQGWPVEPNSQGEPLGCKVMLLCLDLFKLGHAGKARRVYYYYFPPAQNLALVLLISCVQRDILPTQKRFCSPNVLQDLARGQCPGKC